MFRPGILFGVISILLMALPIAAQEQAGNLGRVYFVKPKAGMELQYEEAAKRHRDWHRQQKDTWTWHTWQVVNGERLGQYVVGTFNHTWEDFDAHAEFDAADTADVLANLSKYEESVSNVITLYRPDISGPPNGEVPLPLAVVIRVDLNVGRTPDFNYYQKKFKAAREKTKWGGAGSWFQLVNGSEGPAFVLVLPRKNWAGVKPEERSIPQMLEEAYGRKEAESLLELNRKTVRRVQTDIQMYRPDLSYIPADQ